MGLINLDYIALPSMIRSKISIVRKEVYWKVYNKVYHSVFENSSMEVESKICIRIENYLRRILK